eukprot:scaffold80511_cov26-Prasinocladus_malaysianus.AAC.1
MTVGSEGWWAGTGYVVGVMPCRYRTQLRVTVFTSVSALVFVRVLVRVRGPISAEAVRYEYGRLSLSISLLELLSSSLERLPVPLRVPFSYTQAVAKSTSTRTV